MKKYSIKHVIFLLVVAIAFFSSNVCISQEASWQWQNPLPQGNDLSGVWGTSGSDVYAVGVNGIIRHYDGNGWQAMNSPTNSHSIRGVWGGSASDIFIAGYPDGAIFRYPAVYSPWVVSTFPADKAVGVTVDTAVEVNFSEDIDPSTVTAATFLLSDGTNTISGMTSGGISRSITCSGSKATFQPQQALNYSTVYTATITKGVNDLDSHALDETYTWSFTTQTAEGSGSSSGGGGSGGGGCFIAEVQAFLLFLLDSGSDPE